MSLVTKVLSQVGQRAKMLQNPSLGFFSDDKQVCIGFYVDSYSLMQAHAMLKTGKPPGMHDVTKRTGNLEILFCIVNNLWTGLQYSENVKI